MTEVFVGLQAEVEHPLWLALHIRNLFDHLAAQAAFGFKYVVLGIVKSVFISSDIF
jgi:hypothetical protein